MSDLRTVAQQALTILEAWKHKGMWGDWDGVTDALKAALVEDAMQKFTDVNQELQAALGCDHCNSPLYAAVKCRVCGRATPIIEPEIKGDNKPVAWIYQNANTDREYLVWRKSEGGRNWKPLYTAPPQHKPLTDDEIKKLLIEHAGMTVVFSEVDLRFARAVERAHGIGGSDA